MSTRYVPAFSWPASIEAFVQELVTESPILHVCSGESSFGDTRVDLYVAADVQACWTNLPFPASSYGAVFADPPWNAAYKTELAAFMREATRIAPVVYVMGPWLYGGRLARVDALWVREMPGVQHACLIARYLSRSGRLL